MLSQKVKIFLTVADYKSFSKAALRLSMSTSSVSFHIDTLEKEYGVKLFKRHGRSISLTEEGSLLYKQARELNKKSQMLKNDIASVSKTISHRIRLAGDALTCAFRVPWKIAEFRKTNPDVIFIYEECGQEEVVEKLINDELDLAFVGYRIRNKKIAIEDCYNDQIILVGSGEKEWPDKINVKDIFDYPILWHSKDPGLHETITKGLHEKGVSAKDLNVFIEIEQLTILKNFARAGLGVTFLPKLVVEDELRHGDLKEIKIEGMSLSRCTYRAYKKGSEKNELLKSFVGMMQSSGKACSQ